MTALIALLVLSQSPNIDAEVFVDRGESYIRAGANNGLQVGTQLEVMDAKSRASIGSAVVMEVWEALSRVSLDSKSAAHTPLKVVRVWRAPEAAAPVAALTVPPPPPPFAPPVARAPPAPVTARPPPVVAVPPPAAPAPVVAAPPPAAVVAPPVAAVPPPVAAVPPPVQQPPSGGGLQLIGKVTGNGDGDLRRIVVYNTSNKDWTACDVRLPNNRHYRMRGLDAGDSEGIMLFRFEYDGPPAAQASNVVTVICREGVGRFPIML